MVVGEGILNQSLGEGTSDDDADPLSLDQAIDEIPSQSLVSDADEDISPVAPAAKTELKPEADSDQPPIEQEQAKVKLN